MRRLAGPFSVTCGVSISLVSGSTACGGARVIITEIMYNPASNERKGETEWVEIANVGDEAIDIKDWRLDDEDKTEWGEFSCRLEPGAVAVIVNAAGTNAAQFLEAWGDGAEAAPSPPSAPEADVDEPKPKRGGAKPKKEPAAPVQVGGMLIIPVKWGGLANTPDEDNENLSLLDGDNRTVCEVIFGNGGDWPSVKRPDGFSIYLTDLSASNLSNPEVWKKSAEGKDGAIRSRTNTQFNAEEIGSPGVVPGLRGPVTTASAEKPANEPDAPDEPAKPRQKPGIIDY